MPNPAGQFFGLAPNEHGRQRLQLLSASVSVSASATGVRATVTVPSDETWWVAGITNQSIPGAAQWATRLIIGPVQSDQANAPFTSIMAGSPDDATLPAANQTVSVSTTFGESLMLPGGTVLCAATAFNAGASANTVSINVFGMRTPRGNAI